jgi:hypothetical protein
MASIINASTSSGLVQTADTSGVLQLQTNSGQTAVTIDTSQNVGIGTTSPTSKLQISSASAVDTTLQVSNTLSTTKINTYSDGTSSLETTGAYAQRFFVNGSERMRIDSSGNVGIGTNSPSTNAQGLAIQTTGTSAAGLSIYSPSNTNGARITLIDGQYNSQIYSIPTVGVGTGLGFSCSGPTERMRIDASGNVLINQTSQSGSAGVFAVANTAGSGGVIWVTSTNNSTYYPAIFKNASNANVGNINCTASATAYATSSDYRLKENVAPMTGALDTVAQLKPVTYTWKLDGSNGQGFIAHELQEVVPDCVIGEKDAVDADGNPQYQGVDTSFLVATLTAAIQEQQTIINDLKARITALEGAK